MIDKLRHTHPVDKLCQLVDVAKSGYQTWSRGKVIPARRLEDARLVTAIKAAHQRGRGIDGPNKIQTALAAQASPPGSTASNDSASCTASVARIRRSSASPRIQGISCRWLRIY